MSWLSDIQDGWRSKKKPRRKKNYKPAGGKLLKEDGLSAACRQGRHAACFSMKCKCEHHGTI